jgi:hypothetical protein
MIANIQLVYIGLHNCFVCLMMILLYNENQYLANTDDMYTHCGYFIINNIEPKLTQTYCNEICIK